MNYERSKAPLALMEQIIMILVFALAAAVCLQAFVYANGLSTRGEKENIAAEHAQEVIEMCKTCAGDWQKVVGEMPGQIEGDTLEIPFEQDHMTVQMQKLPFLMKIRKKFIMLRRLGREGAHHEKTKALIHKRWRQFDSDDFCRVMFFGICAFVTVDGKSKL